MCFATRIGTMAEEYRTLKGGVDSHRTIMEFSHAIAQQGKVIAELHNQNAIYKEIIDNAIPTSTQTIYITTTPSNVIPGPTSTPTPPICINPSNMTCDP